MGVIVKPKNLNERQVNRVDRIAKTNPTRATKVAERISARRDARGAENPQMAKTTPTMKKGGIAKAGVKKFGTAGVTNNYNNYKGHQVKTSKTGRPAPAFKKGGSMKSKKSC